jgi:hypothetical protein
MAQRVVIRFYNCSGLRLSLEIFEGDCYYSNKIGFSRKDAMAQRVVIRSYICSGLRLSLEIFEGDCCHSNEIRFLAKMQWRKGGNPQLHLLRFAIVFGDI